MSLNEKFVPVQTSVINFVSYLFKTIARIFGYPKNPGMPINYNNATDVYSQTQYLDNLPEHITFWPPIERPETWFEVIVGTTPKLETIPRYTYESSQEGFYNFYVENYKNIYFLPDRLSEFIQVKLNICLDISILETSREVLFGAIFVYSQLIILRIALSWLLSINPYEFPWYFVIAIVDWTEDALQGLVPSILGVNVTGSVFLGLLGVVADGLNNLVFTIPYLASEGEKMEILMGEETKQVLVFHYLPILWYRHPIPNDIREFWYKERPDILDYMQKAYKDLDIQFLPDNIIQQLNQGSNLAIENFTVNDAFSTHLLSNEFLNNINFLTHQFHNFF